jgi:hypothetical protein
MKKALFFTILSCFMLFNLYSETVRFNDGNSINIDIPANWKVTQHQGTPLPEMGATFDIRLTPPSNEKALLFATIGKSKTGATLTKKQYDSFTNVIVAEYLEGAVEKKAAFIDLPVNNGNGKYCIFTDKSLANKTPAQDEFIYAVLFLANYNNGCFLYATGLTDDISGAIFQNMIKSMSSIEPSLATVVQTPPVKIQTNKQGVLIGNNVSKVKLFIQSNNLKAVKERIGGSQSNPGYFYFTDTKTNLRISGWFDLAEKFKYNNVREFWASEFGKAELLNPEFRKNDVWEIFLYDIPLSKEFPNIFIANMRAIYLQNNTWIDLHLSIGGANKPSADLHNDLVAYLNEMKIIE